MKNRWQGYIIVCFFGWLSITGAAWGQTLIVGPGDGFETIQAAVNAAANGDEIVVRQGDYMENVVVDKPIILRSETTAGAVVTAAEADEPVFDIQSDQVTLIGFSLYGATQDSAGILIGGVRDCTLLENTCGISAGQGNVVGIALLDADECYLHGNTLIGNQVGIALIKAETGDGANSNTLVGNHCTFNISGAIGVFESTGNYLDTNVCVANQGSGITLYQSSDNHVAWNECSDNGAVGISVEGEGNTIVENQVEGNRYGVVLGAGAANAVVLNRSVHNRIGILTLGATNNRIYLNSLDQNSGYNALSWGSTNRWHSPDPITYYVDGISYHKVLGNFYGDHDLTDADHDAVADRAYLIPRDGSQDEQALVLPAGEYDLILPGAY